MPRTSARLTVLLGFLTASAVAAWNPDYAWHDPVTNTPSQSAKPGGGGLYGTGSTYEGGVQCAHCHLPRPGTGAPLDLRITFNPPLSGGRYARSTRYTITVDMLNEHNLCGDARVGLGADPILLPVHPAHPASLGHDAPVWQLPRDPRPVRGQPWPHPVALSEALRDR